VAPKFFTFSQDPENFEQNLAEYVSKTYDEIAQYYINATEENRKRYDIVRIWTIILGASVTLMASLSAADFIKNVNNLTTIFTITTAVLAAILTILNGLNQSFHWRENWGDLNIFAQRIKIERDRFLSTKPANRDYKKELVLLNTLILEQSTQITKGVLSTKDAN